MKIIISLIILTLTCICTNSLADPIIENVQLKLFLLGYDAGQVDGAMGKKTISALSEFQKAEGLEVTGRADEDTISALRVDDVNLNAIIELDKTGRIKMYTGPVKASPRMRSLFLSTSDGVTIQIYGKDYIVPEAQAERLGLLKQKTKMKGYRDGVPVYVTSTDMPEVNVKAVIGKSGDEYRLLQIKRIQ